MHGNTKRMALGGLLAALALVIQSLGGLIPLATYIVPMLCCILQDVVVSYCGRRLAWVWYAAVALLSLLLGPDKEAVGVFLVIGYYPILKPMFEKSRLSVLWKALLFNAAIALLYGLLLQLLGLEAAAAETGELGMVGLAVMLILGNLVFFLLDRLLTILHRKRRRA